MAKKPRKPHTSRKRIITPETRTKIARALAAKLGPTSDWDKPEPTGRKTNGIDKTTGHKITISTPKRTLTKPKTPPNPNTIHNPNGTKAGGHRASTHYLNTQKSPKNHSPKNASPNAPTHSPHPKKSPNTSTN
ncbi:hypothetical protein ACQXZ0_02210 [Corynebacterium diphtheriae]